VATAFATALLAVFVFVLTQSFLKLVLEPIQEQRKLIGEIASALTVYERGHTLRVINASGGEAFFGATKEKAEETDKSLRGLAGRLKASLWSFPTYRMYEMFARFHMVLKPVDVVVAIDELHMWYSQLPNPVNEHQDARIRECQSAISKRLGIEHRLQVLRPQGIPSEEAFYTAAGEDKD